MSRFRKPPTRLLVATLVVLAVMLAAETVVLAAGTIRKSSGPVKAVYTATSNDELWLTSTTLADMPEMSTTVSVPSGQTALLIITFSAETSCTGLSAWCQVWAVVDTTAAAPAGYSFDNSSGGAYPGEAHSMQWVAGPVGPGQHRVRLRYLVGPTDGSGTFTVGVRTLTVLRSKL